MLQVALRLDPGHTGALTNVGALKAREGHSTEALRYTRKAYAGNHALTLVCEADEQRKAGHPAEALPLYQEALAVQPSSAQAREGLEALSAGRPAGGARP